MWSTSLCPQDVFTFFVLCYVTKYVRMYVNLGCVIMHFTFSSRLVKALGLVKDWVYKEVLLHKKPICAAV